MNGTKATGKTIGEVEKLTGIPKRELKYYIERRLMLPSQRSEIGYWLYSERDISNARIVSLCRELGYPAETIRRVISETDFQWREELERQISRLEGKKERLEAQLFLAEYMLYSGFGGEDMDLSVSGSLLWEKGRLRWSEDSRQAFCGLLCEIVTESETAETLRGLSELRACPPEAPIVRERAEQLCEALRRSKGLSPAQALLVFRLAGVMSGAAQVLDRLLGCECCLQFIADALQVYCEGSEEKDTALV